MQYFHCVQVLTVPQVHSTESFRTGGYCIDVVRNIVGITLEG